MTEDYVITDGSIIVFHDLFRGEEEDGLITVGRRDIGAYVSLPGEAVEVIDLLNSGKPVGQVKKTLEEKYGEEAEIEEFIEDMIKSEMVKSVDGYEIATTSHMQKDLFSMVTERHVGWMFSRYAQIVYAGTAISCLVIFALVPDYIPEPRDYFFHPMYSVAVGFMTFFGWVLVAYHELAHLFAAKAVGTEGYFSLSNRLVFIVAQTNLGNIWTISREKRYIVYFAGMAWDAVMVFICLLLLLLSDNGIAPLSTLWYNFLKAIIFIKVWGIIWQFRFNMQTDVYYTVVNFFKCRNLLGDAQNYLKNILSRFTSRFNKTDFAGTPDYEMRAIKWYSLLYFVGTFVTLATYFLRTIPLLWLRLVRAYEGIVIGYAEDPGIFTDAVILIVLTAFNFGLLGFVILRPRWSKLKEQFHARFG
ncbi:MAG: hypothetical protein HXS44_04785 [Theionarchaea archaeon]|nr:hypothetical protein [Theionarchaea archaeon]